MVDTSPGETYAEIAAATAALTTVRNQWARHPQWPEPLPEKRGRCLVFDPAAVNRFVTEHLDRQAADLEPVRLYTAREIEQLTGITAATIRADRSRGREHRSRLESACRRVVDRSLSAGRRARQRVTDARLMRPTADS
ncbi:hypothetical protein [Streptomyces sp. HF10]|uniref:hypothetical protein n=1 Tax=Streptomyces sp. HF10 TaxID=2692233 RepID=UPI0013178B3F|nr:hypothetical protein [Streptomyces sp. HF10]QHC31992.1 hypothetical protein GR129_27535 [Streptomyces sp. HF10]